MSRKPTKGLQLVYGLNTPWKVKTREPRVLRRRGGHPLVGRFSMGGRDLRNKERGRLIVGDLQ
jgi:hypothetical protein